MKTSQSICSPSNLPTQANPTVSSPANFADFQFRTIGQQAKFLNRLSDPGSQLHQDQHPSPSPPPCTGSQPLHHDLNIVPISSDRPTLLQALYDPCVAMAHKARPARKDLQSGATDNAPDPSGANLSKTVDSRSCDPQSSSPQALAMTVPLSLPRKELPLDSSHSSHGESSLASHHSFTPTTSLGYSYPTSSQSTVTLPQTDHGLGITHFQKSTLPQLQSRLRCSLTTLDALSLVATASSTTSTLSIPPRTPAKALHNARQAAQVSVSQADSSLHAAQAVHTSARKSVDSARQALELAQQSLTVAQAAYAAAEQSAADVQVSLSSAREARERADEAMLAIGRMDDVLDAQERDLATREARVRNVVVDTRAIVVAIDGWFSEQEQEKIKGQERRKEDDRRLRWEAETRRMDEERRRAEMEGRRAAAEVEADIARRAWDRAQIDAARTNEDDQRQGVDSQVSGPQSSSIETHTPVQPDQVHNQPTAEPLHEMGRSGLQKAKETFTEDPKEREEELRKTQQKKRQEVMIEKRRAAAAAAAKIVEDRKEISGVSRPPATPSPMSRVPKQAPTLGNRGTNQYAFVTSNGSPLVSTPAPLSMSVALPTLPAVHPIAKNSVSSTLSQTFPKPTEPVNSNIALSNRFIPAMTEAGRLIQTDMPFSSTTLASENGQNTAKDINGASVCQSDNGIGREISPQNTLPPSRSSIDLRRGAPQGENHVSSSPSPTNIPINSINDARPVGCVRTPPPTWTVLKREPSADMSDNGVESGVVHELCITSVPPPSHIEQASDLCHPAEVTSKSNSGLTIKRESSVNHSVMPPPQKANGTDVTVNVTSRARDSTTANPQAQPISRSISPAVSTGSNPIHSQISVPPPRMKKTWATARRDSVNTNAGERIVTSQDSEDAHVNTLVDPTAMAKTSKSPVDDIDFGNTTRNTPRDGSNGWGDDFAHTMRRSEERATVDAGIGRSYRPDAQHNEYKSGDVYGSSMVQQQRPTVARGNDRPWSARGAQPSQFTRSPSPIARRPIHAQLNPPPRAFISDPSHTGITPVPSSPPSISVSRPYRRQGDHYSPTSSPQLYGRSLHPISSPSPPQIVGRKRIREDNSYRVHSDSHRPWVEDSGGRETRRARMWPETAESNRIFGSISAEPPLASRMQDPAEASSPVNFGQSDGHPDPSYAIPDAQLMGSHPATRFRDNHQSSGNRNLPNDRNREYERGRIAPPPRREKHRENNPDIQRRAEAEQQPHLLSRMSDQAGPSPRGIHNGRRAFERGRGLSRTRGGVPARGSARGPTHHAIPLQQRIG